jgi:magnesium-transporting ATPase (P-type)
MPSLLFPSLPVPRVSPDQKREMVHLIKTEVPGVRTLAIGDGANDVAMIQEAHIGVGIRGEEGLQATNASDYAIAQFRYLSILLLKHGRYNYLRMCSLVCYMFYKNIFMSICQFWFAWLNGFSGSETIILSCVTSTLLSLSAGQKIYTEGGIQLYNLAFTSIPILLSGIYDMDVPAAAVIRHPELYKLCIQNAYFSVQTHLPSSLPSSPSLAFSPVLRILVLDRSRSRRVPPVYLHSSALPREL